MQEMYPFYVRNCNLIYLVHGIFKTTGNFNIFIEHTCLRETIRKQKMSTINLPSLLLCKIAQLKNS